MEETETNQSLLDYQSRGGSTPVSRRSIRHTSSDVEGRRRNKKKIEKRTKQLLIELLPEENPLKNHAVAEPWSLDSIFSASPLSLSLFLMRFFSIMREPQLSHVGRHFVHNIAGVVWSSQFPSLFYKSGDLMPHHPVLSSTGHRFNVECALHMTGRKGWN